MPEGYHQRLMPVSSRVRTPASPSHLAMCVLRNALNSAASQVEETQFLDSAYDGATIGPKNAFLRFVRRIHILAVG